MVYGFMTHSFLNSTEHRQMKAERAKLTAQWKPDMSIEVLPACTCRYKPFPHIDHSELMRMNDWRPRK